MARARKRWKPPGLGELRRAIPVKHESTPYERKKILKKVLHPKAIRVLERWGVGPEGIKGEDLRIPKFKSEKEREKELRDLDFAIDSITESDEHIKRVLRNSRRQSGRETNTHIDHHAYGVMTAPKAMLQVIRSRIEEGKE